MTFTPNRFIPMTWHTIHRRLRPIEAQAFWFVGFVMGLLWGYIIFGGQP